ncbi:MAG: zinc ribbon domain-containing protein [Verrucomicrobiota bacterium]
MPLTDFRCPTCGAEVSPNAAGCPECGARKVEGRWVDPASYDGLDLPDEDDFDYEDFVEREFGSGRKRKTAKEWFWWVVAILLLIAFAFMVLPF